MLKIWAVACFCALGAGVFSNVARGAESVKELKVGDPAPDVTVKDETGKDVKLSSYKDKSGLVIFFFPKAFTGG